MQKVDNRIILSASDLVGHLNCHYLSKLDFDLASGNRSRPKDDELRLDAIRRLGFEHENKFVAHLRTKFSNIVSVEGDRISPESVAATERFMREGADIIIQAAFDNGNWRGKADILRKVEGKPSTLGSWSYEVIDTKLASETKGGTILQLCLYAEFVRKIQGVLPEYVYVVPPSDNFDEQVYRTTDYLAYFRKVKRSLETTVEKRLFDGLYPEPVAHCDVCRWQFECEKKRRDDDHLSLVAGITKLQTIELVKRDITTCTSLAAIPVPIQWKPERGTKEAIFRVREQARIQVEGKKAGKVIHEMLENGDDFGLKLLPEPNQGDIFFDLEGDPFVGTQGLEYLFGYAFFDAHGDLQYEAIWAHDLSEEKQAFETFMSFVSKRLVEFPDLHIYHYAPYEPAALKRLMGRHATCEAEIDQLLRGRRFIDLYAVVRRSIRASVESYSIKKLEPLFGFNREQDLKVASQTRMIFEMQLETGLAKEIEADAREIVRKYNKDDCISNYALRNWLESERSRLILDGRELPRPPIHSGEASETLQDWQLANVELKNRLLKDISLDSTKRSANDVARSLMANMLEWHWREQKVALWEKFRLMALDADELLEDPAALLGLKFSRTSTNNKGKTVYRFSFPVQETEMRTGSRLFTMNGDECGIVSEISVAEGWVETEKNLAIAHGDLNAIFTADIMQRNAIKLPISAIRRIAEDIADVGLDSCRFKAASSLLLNEYPVVQGENLRNENEDALTAACRIVKDLNGRVLSIQGPPGTGKTFTAAHMICALIAEGKRVGITATSHKVIRNLVDKVLEISHGESQNFQCVMRIDDEKSSNGVVQNIRIVKAADNAGILKKFQATRAPLIAATVFFWAREDVEQLVDVLFVDEAAQMSLANVIVASQAAKSLVLIGDPRQLEQPLRGSHPDGADVSSLDHVIGNSDTISDDRGIFLDTTFRLNPDICAFTSELFYEDRLRSRPGNEKIALKSGSSFSGSGLRYVLVSHEGNRNGSLEEVEAIVRIIAELTSGKHIFRDHAGSEHVIGAKDILIVAPYNVQVSKLRQRLPGANIGTVDKFQGQEAPVVIYSLTSSSQEDAPRGMEFLYSLNRLNVATSRAKAMCILVGSPTLFDASCRSPRQIQLANALCRYLEMAEAVPIEHIGL